MDCGFLGGIQGVAAQGRRVGLLFAPVIRLHFVDILTGLAVAAQDLELTLREIINKHLIELLGQLKNATKYVHFILKNASTVATSGAGLW